MARIKVESKSSSNFASHGFLKKKDVLLEAKTRSGKASANAAASLKVRRRRLKRQGTPSSYAFDRIKKAQKSIHQKPQKGAFYRAVRDIVEEISPGIHLQTSAFAALREAAEAQLIKYFKMMGLIANHADRVTIQIEDSEVVKQLFGCFGPSGVSENKRPLLQGFAHLR